MIHPLAGPSGPFAAPIAIGLFRASAPHSKTAVLA